MNLSAGQDNKVPESLLRSLPPGISKEEELWSEAVKEHERERGWFLRAPTEVFLLLGLIFAIAIIAISLSSLDILSDASFESVMTSEIPLALGISGVLIVVGWVHRLKLQIYDNKIEETYRELLNHYGEHHTNSTSATETLDTNLQIIDSLNLLRKDLSGSLDENLRKLQQTLDHFKTDVATVSSSEVERTLNRFSREIQEIPQKISQALDARSQDATKDQVEFRKAVSGLLQWPTDLKRLNESMEKSADQLGGAFAQAVAHFERMDALVSRFESASETFGGTTGKMQEVADKLDRFTRDFKSKLDGFEEGQRQFLGDVQQTIHGINADVEQGLTQIMERTDATINNLSHIAERLHAFFDSLAQRTQEQDERYQTFFEEITRRLDEQNRKSHELIESMQNRVDTIYDVMGPIINRVNDGVQLAIREALDENFKRDLSQAIADAVGSAVASRKRSWRSLWPF